MRFTIHGSESVHGIKIDWDVPIEGEAEMREAMAPHDLATMHLGVLRRGYAVGPVVYPRGTLACRIAEGHEIFLQVPEHVAARPSPAPVAAPVAVWTVERDATGERHRIVVDAERDGLRVDATIASVADGISRALAQRLIDDGQVRLGGQVIKKANQRLRAGDVIEIVVAREHVAATPKPPDIEPAPRP